MTSAKTFSLGGLFHRRDTAPDDLAHAPVVGADEELVDVAVVILTFNEEENIAYALRSVCGWAKQVFVFDSFSSDRTLEIAREFPCEIMQHPFTGYAAQRQAALDRLPITAEWVLFLDADEWVPGAMRREIAQLLAASPIENGFFCRFRFMWMGKWIRRGYYSTWILRLFRAHHARMESREIAEQVVIDGGVGYLNTAVIHEDRKGISKWIEKHNRYATMEAEALYEGPTAGELDAKLLGTQAQRKRWIRHNVWRRLPLYVRPSLYFLYRYVLRGGFLDGREAFTYHFLQALWTWMLVDIKYAELRRTGRV